MYVESVRLVTAFSFDIVVGRPEEISLLQSLKGQSTRKPSLVASVKRPSIYNAFVILCSLPGRMSYKVT